MVATGAPGPPVVDSLLLVGMDRRPKSAAQGSIAPPSRPANGPVSVGNHRLATKTPWLICRPWSGKARSVRQCPVRIGILGCRTAHVAGLLTSMGSIYLGGLHTASARPSSPPAEVQVGTLRAPQPRHPKKRAVPMPISVEMSVGHEHLLVNMPCKESLYTAKIHPCTQKNRLKYHRTWPARSASMRFSCVTCHVGSPHSHAAILCRREHPEKLFRCWLS